MGRSPKAKLTPLLGLTILLIVLSYGRAHELLASTASLPVGKVLSPICLFLLATRPDFKTRLTSLKSPQGRFLGLFLFAAIISVPMSLWIGGSVMELKDFALAKLPYLVILFGAAKTEGDLDWLLRAVVIAVIFFGAVIMTGGGTATEGRAYAGDTYDPNDIAMIAAVSLPFALRLILDRSFLWKGVGFVGLSAALMLVLQTGSRGGMLAVGAIVLGYLLLLRQSLPGRMKFLLIAGIGIGLALAPGAFLQRMKTLGDLGSDYNTYDPLGRMEIWKRGMGYFASRPLTGVGIGQFSAAEGESLRLHAMPGEPMKWSTAHNSFVLAAAELGIFGIVGFLGLFLPIFPLVRKVRRSARADRSRTSLASQGEAIAIGTIGFLVAGFFLSATYGPAALTLAAFGIAYAGIVKRSATAAAAGPSRAAPGRGSAMNPGRFGTR
jgi:O-antigen ligase